MVYTRINNGYVFIPKYLRDKLKINDNDKLDIKINERGNLEIILSSKKTLEDFIGIIDNEDSDAVEDKRKIARGEKLR